MSFTIDGVLSKDPGIKTVGMAGHISPDGDCIGSSLGLYLYVKKNYPQLRCDIFMESVPEELSFLKGSNDIRTDFKTDVNNYDVFFILDTVKDRTNKAEKLFDNASLKVMIDHHVSNKGGADLDCIVTDSSSTCEVLCDLLDFEKMDKDIAMCLYTGIVTDTGIFHYSSTSPKTMRTAAKLMEFDFDHSELIEKVELEKRYSQNLALGKMLSKSKLLLDGKVISSFADADDIKNNGFTSEDFEGVVSQMNLTVGVECAIFVNAADEGKIRVSLRSKGNVNVSEIAVSLGGGGHARAAGCTLNGYTCEEAIDMLVVKVKEQLGL